MESIFILALVTESIWETLKMIKQKDKIHYDKIGAAIVGILVAVAANIDIFDYFATQIRFRFLGYIFTGILISRGSNFIHDLLGSINCMYQRGKQ